MSLFRVVARQGRVGQGPSRQAWPVSAWLRVSRFVTAGRARQGTSCQVASGPVMAGQAGQGWVRRVPAWSGAVWQASNPGNQLSVPRPTNGSRDEVAARFLVSGPLPLGRGQVELYLASLISPQALGVVFRWI